MIPPIRDLQMKRTPDPFYLLDLGSPVATVSLPQVITSFDEIMVASAPCFEGYSPQDECPIFQDAPEVERCI